MIMNYKAFIKYQWAVFYQGLYIEKTMHNKQFSHDIWCWRKYRKDEADKLLSMAIRYSNNNNNNDDFNTIHDLMSAKGFPYVCL